jgi:hypothetical protein
MSAPQKVQPAGNATVGAVAHTTIDTDSYPIHDRGSQRYWDLVNLYRQQIADVGCAVIKDFVRPEALERMRGETTDLAPRAHYNNTYTNPYNSADDPSLPEDHPKRTFADRTNAFVAGDLIETDTEVRRLYHDPGFQQFLADVLGVERIHEYADPLAGLVINVLQPNCQHPWHFDTNEFIVTMMTQQSEAGGRFEYVPEIRSSEDENFDEVGRVVHGDHSQVRVLDVKPGDVQIFFGRFSLHRVSRVEGESERHTVILGYSKQPGQIGKAERTRKLFGRTAEVHHQEEATNAGRSDKLSD